MFSKTIRRNIHPNTKKFGWQKILEPKINTNRFFGIRSFSADISAEEQKLYDKLLPLKYAANDQYGILRNQTFTSLQIDSAFLHGYLRYIAQINNKFNKKIHPTYGLYGHIKDMYQLKKELQDYAIQNKMKISFVYDFRQGKLLDVQILDGIQGLNSTNLGEILPLFFKKQSDHCFVSLTLNQENEDRDSPLQAMDRETYARYMFAQINNLILQLSLDSLRKSNENSFSGRFSPFHCIWKPPPSKELKMYFNIYWRKLNEE